MKKKFLSILCVLALCMQLTPVISALAPAQVTIRNFQQSTKLETIVSEDIYDGTQEVPYLHTPTPGYQYLLVYVDVQVSSGESVNTNNIFVTVDGNDYARIQEDSFLEYHQYALLGHGIATISDNGWVVFEIPTSVTEEEILEEASLTVDGVTAAFQKADAADPFLITQDYYGGFAARQKELEESYLAIANKGNYTAENPYIILNPYEIAPLSAIIVFETETPVSVTSVIHGKGEGLAYDLTTISNTVEAKKTHHEIPLIGLYNGDNTVDLILDDGTSQVSYTHAIHTDVDMKSSAGATEIDVIHEDLTQLSDGLYVVKDNARTLVDATGEIRGFFSMWLSNSRFEEVTEDGHIFAGYGSNFAATLIELDYLGYIYREISVPGVQTDHDGYLLDDSTFLMHEEILDLDTLTLSPYERSWEELFNAEDGSAEIRSYGTAEWAHFNTVEYGGDGYILVSMRNQHAVAKISYPEMEVQWILSVNPNALNKNDNPDKYLTPLAGQTEFEWFYSQHHVSLLSENEDGTIDIALFDNGAARGLDPSKDYPVEDMYSRMVRYRIDEENMTVEQIWDFGEEIGLDSCSYVNGSTEYIVESDTYLGNFNTFTVSALDKEPVPKSGEIMTILEVNQEKDIVLEWHLNRAAYRIEKCDKELLYRAWQGFDATESVYKYIGNPVVEYTGWQTQETPAVYQFHTITANQDYMNVSGWVGVQDALSSTLINRRMIFQNRETGEAYVYALTNDGAQVKNPNIPASLKGTIHSSAGFSQELINISQLEDGDYSIVLLATCAGKHHEVKTDYTLQIGEPEAVLNPVENKDILVKQGLIDSQLTAQYDPTDDTLANPMVVVDPYGLSPLSAIAMFSTVKPAHITVTVESKNGADDIVGSFDDVTTDHIVPIYGLYAQEPTNVTFTATYEDGTTECSTIPVTGGIVPSDLVRGEITTINKEEMADGLTFISLSAPTNYSFAVDTNGDVRWVYSEVGGATRLMPMTLMDNGHILTCTDTGNVGNYKYGVQEMDLTGKVYNQYLTGDNHHDVIEMSNGHFLVPDNDPSGNVIEDTVYEVDNVTGEIVRAWDMDAYFNVLSFNEEGNHISDVNYGADDHDWFHNNSVAYDADDDAMLLSGRMQDSVIKIDMKTGELLWILSDPSDEWGDDMKDKLLTPVGDDFEWSYGQHHVELLPDGDILLFDNGNYRSKTVDGVVPVTENYSRIVRYHVNDEDMTVEQVWEYGKERGSELFANYVGGHMYLGEDHYLGHFGGIVKNKDGDASYSLSDAISGGGHSESAIVEIKNDEVVFEYRLTGPMNRGNSYRSARFNPYTVENELTMAEGTRFGELMIRNAASTANLDAIPVSQSTTTTQVADYGFYLQFTGVAGATKAVIYFEGENKSYQVPVSLINSACKVHSCELPLGTYELSVGINGERYPLDLSWENTVVGKPVPTRYQIDVASSDATMGSAYGTGLYYPNTALTVTAMVEDGYEFAGWQQDGKTVSTDAEYSFIPTANATLTAIFEIEEDDTPSGGSTGGSSSGGGSFVTPTYSVETSYEGEGVITPKADELFEGQSETFYFEAAEGYEITDVLVNGKSVGAVDEYTVEDIDDDIVIEVIFSEIEATPLAFVDVVEGAYYYDAVRWAVENGVTSGTTDTTFSPDTVCTRAQAVTFLWKAAGSPVMDSEMTFTDVAKGAWYYDAVLWAVTNGITDGTGDGSTFSPDMTCDRSQIITFIWRSEGEPVVDYLMDYTDVPADTWYTEAVRWAVSKGITDGTSDTTFSPALDCTRGQIVTFMYRNS